MIAECKRHGFPNSPPRFWDWHTGEAPFYVSRCAHFGNRFIVELRNVVTSSVYCDYVEDLEVTEGDDVIVESHYRSDDIGIDALWEHLESRLLADDPPNPEAC
jgi:hypothetical protein